jgi:hypothetical protein
VLRRGSGRPPRSSLTLLASETMICSHAVVWRQGLRVKRRPMGLRHLAVRSLFLCQGFVVGIPCSESRIYRANDGGRPRTYAWSSDQLRRNIDQPKISARVVFDWIWRASRIDRRGGGTTSLNNGT